MSFTTRALRARGIPEGDIVPAKEYRQLLRMAMVHPSWALAYATESLLQRFHYKNHHAARAIEYGQYLYRLDDAIAKATSQPLSSARSVLENVPTGLVQLARQVPIPEDWDATDELSACVYAICRLAKPSVVIETGVARGATSVHILEALHQNDFGHLYSIDLPPLLPGAEVSTGCLVPNSLKVHWTLKLGSSQRILPGLLKEVEGVDVFICDSSHTYRCQRLEYRLAWPSLRPGGILISDDIGNDSLIEVAEEYGITPIIVAQSKPKPIGILVKPM